MAVQINSFHRNIPFYPLYLKFASEFLHKEKVPDGMDFFSAVCDNPTLHANAVYEKLWKVKGKPKGDPEFGRKSFHGLDGLTSSANEKARAIDKYLKKYDQNELQLQADKLYEYLWKIHGKPLMDLEYGRHAFHCMHGCYASWDDINLALAAYENDSLVETWFTHDAEARLIELTKGKLNCLIYNVASKKMWTIPANFFELPKIKDYVIAINKGSPVVSKFRDVEGWPCSIPCFTDRTVKLCSLDNELKWYVFDKSTDSASWAPAGDDALQALKYLKEIPQTERVSCIKNDFDIRMQFDQNTECILTASIEKISAPSKFENVAGYIGLGAGIIAISVIAYNVLSAIKGRGGSMPKPSIPGHITAGGGHVVLAKNIFIGKGHLTNAINNLNQSNIPTTINSNINVDECGFLRDVGREFLGKLDHTQKKHIKIIETYEKIEILDAKKHRVFFRDLKILVKDKYFPQLNEYLKELQDVVDNFSKKRYEKLIFRVRAYVEKRVFI